MNFSLQFDRLCRIRKVTKIYQKMTQINEFRGELRSTRSRYRLMIDEVLCEPRSPRNAHTALPRRTWTPQEGRQSLHAVCHRFSADTTHPLWDIEQLNQMKRSIDQKNRTLMAHTGAGHSFAVRGVLEPARVTFRTGFFSLVLDPISPKWFAQSLRKPPVL